MKNKKGVEINITTIIILVLAILVLVILALYFTGGMKSLWDQIRGKSSVYNSDDISTAKQLCETSEKAQYCATTIQLYNKEAQTQDAYYCWGSMISADLRDPEGKILDGFRHSSTASGLASEGTDKKPSGCEGYV